MDMSHLFAIWSCAAMGALLLVVYVVVVALRSSLRRNEKLTMMLAVREAHGGKGTDAARAHVAAIKGLTKPADLKMQGGIGSPITKPKSLTLRQTTP